MLLDDQKRALEDALRARGWRISIVERPFEHEWWAEEFWVIQCDDRAAPAVWLTFLVDPVSDGRDVWAVLACRERPGGFESSNGRPELHLGERWRDELPWFVEHMDQWCTGATEA